MTMVLLILDEHGWTDLDGACIPICADCAVFRKEIVTPLSSVLLYILTLMVVVFSTHDERRVVISITPSNCSVTGNRT
jgi:hypothetical protein